MWLAVQLPYVKLPLQYAGFTELSEEPWHQLTLLFQLRVGTNLNYSNDPASRHEEILHAECNTAFEYLKYVCMVCRLKF